LECTNACGMKASGLNYIGSGFVATCMGRPVHSMVLYKDKLINCVATGTSTKGVPTGRHKDDASGIRMAVEK